MGIPDIEHLFHVHVDRWDFALVLSCFLEDPRLGEAVLHVGICVDESSCKWIVHLVSVVDNEGVKGQEDWVILLGAFTPLVVDHQLAIYDIFELHVLLLRWLLTGVVSLYVKVGYDSSEVVLTVNQEPK